MKQILILFVLIVTVAVFTSCSGQSNEGALNPKSSSALLQDKAGNFWFVSEKEGVFRYDGKSFINYTEKDGMSSNFVYCILEDNEGILWFGTADGISCFDGKKFFNIPITTITNSNSYRKTTTNNFGDIKFCIILSRISIKVTYILQGRCIAISKIPQPANSICRGISKCYFGIK